MSTHASILIELKDEHKNCKLVQDQTFIETYTKRSLIHTPEIDVSKSTNFLGIYCHHDGYPSGVGESLRKLFNTYDLALNLILGGDTSSIGEFVDYYNLFPNEEWKNIQPRQLKEMNSLCSPSYLYIFMNDRWLIQVDEYNYILLPNNQSIDLDSYIQGVSDGIEIEQETIRMLCQKV